MMRFAHMVAGFLIALAVICPAQATVNDATANGFSVAQTLEIAASPDKVYGQLIVPARWWSSRHTFSHSADNLVLDARAGGCWCEKLPNGGSVLHLTVVNVVPGQTLVLRGALGPLQGLGVDGALAITLKPAGAGTELSLTYNVGGYRMDGLQSWAAPVDGVLGEQMARLKALIETGSPEPKGDVK